MTSARMIRMMKINHQYCWSDSTLRILAGICDTMPEKMISDRPWFGMPNSEMS
jgi:hypothetical protein